MRFFSFDLPFPIPSKKNCYVIHQRGQKRWIGKKKVVTDAEEAVALIARTKLPKTLKTPIGVTLHVWQSKKRHRIQDADNIVGVIFDGLVKSGRIKDDSMKQIPKLQVWWRGRGEDRVRVVIQELPA